MVTRGMDPKPTLQAVNSRDLRINNSQAPKSQQLEIDATRAIGNCGHLGLLGIG